MNHSHLFGNNILCVRLDNMGDVILCSPAIKAIKNSIPKSNITLLSSSTSALIAPLIPGIDHFITYDAPWVKQTPSNNKPDDMFNIIKLLKNFNFDSVIIFTTYTQSALPMALIAYLAEIPVRIAYSRENPYYLLTHWQKEKEPDSYIRHEVKRQIDLVKNYGCQAGDTRLCLSHPKTGKDKIKFMCKNFPDKWYLLHAGSSAESRRYSLSSFAEVIQLMHRSGWRTILTGNEQEVSYIEELNKACGNKCINLCGVLSIEELCALIDLAPLLISNNTGPVHIASAVQTPVVVLYALTNPQHTPWQVPSKVLFKETPCRFCYKSICPEINHPCLDSISPREVVTAANGLLEQIKPASICSQRHSSDI